MSPPPAEFKSTVRTSGDGQQRSPSKVKDHKSSNRSKTGSTSSGDHKFDFSSRKSSSSSVQPTNPDIRVIKLIKDFQGLFNFELLLFAFDRFCSDRKASFQFPRNCNLACVYAWLSCFFFKYKRLHRPQLHIYQQLSRHFNLTYFAYLSKIAFSAFGLLDC